MRIFGRAKGAGSSSAYRRVSVTPVKSPVAAVSDDTVPIEDLSRTEEMPIVREAAHVAPPQVAAPLATLALAGEDDGDSDVFVVRRRAGELPAGDLAEAAAAAAAAAEGVTLFVYGWENVEPGPLSWAFPSLQTALLAVRTMRNAVEWCIVAGREPSVDAARAKGAILIEQNF